MTFNYPVSGRVAVSAFWSGLGVLMLFASPDPRVYFAALACFSAAIGYADAAYMAHLLHKVRQRQS